MKGTYRFYEDGKLVGEQENLITNDGKRAILRYLAGYTNGIIQTLAVGVGSTAAAVTDTRLQFEFDRAPVSVTSLDLTTQKIVFKATLNRLTEGSINEVGGFSFAETNEVAGARMLTSFDPDFETWSAGAWQTDTTKIGGESLRLTPALSTTTTAVLTPITLDLSEYRSVDKFFFAWANNNSNATAIKFQLRTDASNYYEFSGSTAIGYNIGNVAKGSMAAVGSPSWANLTALAVSVTAGAGGAASVDFDGIRLESGEASNPDYAMVSRTVLGSPISKNSKTEMEIEYSLDVTI